MSIYKWLDKLKKWIQSFFKKRVYKIQSLPLVGHSCSILKVYRSEIPSAVKTYRIIPHVSGQFDFLFTLDSYREVQKEYLGEFNGSDIFVSTPHDQRYSPFTHRLAIFFVLPNGNAIPYGIWDVDLIGISSGTLAEVAPSRAIASLVREALKIKHEPEYGTLFTWQAKMQYKNWMLELQKFSRLHLNLPNHDIKVRVLYEIDKRY